MRIQAAIQLKSYDFNVGLTLGSMLIICNLLIGAAAVYTSQGSKKLKKDFFYLNIIFICISLIIIWVIGTIIQKATMIEGFIMIITWILYIGCILILRSKEYRLFKGNNLLF